MQFFLLTNAYGYKSHYFTLEVLKCWNASKKSLISMSCLDNSENSGLSKQYGAAVLRSAEQVTLVTLRYFVAIKLVWADALFYSLIFGFYLSSRTERAVTLLQGNNRHQNAALPAVEQATDRVRMLLPSLLRNIAVCHDMRHEQGVKTSLAFYDTLIFFPDRPSLDPVLSHSHPPVR
jgi:hypothetical protein